MAPPRLQAMDLTCLRAALSDLRRRAVPGRFETARQPDPRTIQLGLRTLAGMVWLEISWQAEAPRIVSVPAPSPHGEGSTLARQLRHGLRPLALVAMHQEGFERVVELRFAPRPGAGVTRRLIVELMGRHSNLLLLDARQRLMALGRQVPESRSRVRPLASGDTYRSPPPPPGRPPSLTESFEAWRGRLVLLPQPLGAALRQVYQGISPSLALQLAAADPGRAAQLLQRRTDRISEEDWRCLWHRWRCWLEALAGERFCFRPLPEGAYRCWRAPEDGPSSGESPPLAEALARHCHGVLGARRLQEALERLDQRLGRARAREEREIDRQRKLLEEAGEAEDLRHRADALLCLPRPDRDQIDAAQALYRRSRKLRRSRQLVSERIAHHRGRLEALEASRTFLEGIREDPGGIERRLELVADLCEDCGTLLEDRRQTPRRRREKAAAVPCPMELRSPGGLRLQVGRNHRQNDWISLRQARRGDLWFHAQECPGSHVVLKCSEGAAGTDDLQAAADLAALFSRARGNQEVPVVSVPTDRLQRLAGATPGTVRHSGGEVVWGRPERAAALLAGQDS